MELETFKLTTGTFLGEKRIGIWLECLKYMAEKEQKTRSLFYYFKYQEHKITFGDKKGTKTLLLGFGND